MTARRLLHDFWIFAVAFVIIGIPFWIVLVNSFKPLGAAQVPSLRWPREWAAAENYRTVIVQGKYPRALANTLKISAVAIAMELTFGSMAAWVFARARSRLLRITYYISILGVFVPGSIITLIGVLRFFGLQGSPTGLVCAFVGGALSFVIFLITGFVKTVPFELESAARIDGAGSFLVFFRIVFPLLKPILVTTGSVLLTGAWNEFFRPLLLLQSSRHHTIPLSLFNFFGNSIMGFNWHLIFAFVILSSIPLIVLYFIMQRWVVGGMVSGALRG